jgi:hypothetical protein
MAVAVAAAVPATAAAPGPKGTLTAVEYQQLIKEQVDYNKLKHKKKLTWNDFYAVCHDVGQSTRLTKSIRSNCETGVGIDQSLAGFYSDLERCSALSATTTATTTTPTSTTTTTGTTTTTTATGTTTTGTTTTAAGDLTPADLKLLACMQPEYAVISRAVKSIYNTQISLRKEVVARKFVGRCELTLAPTTAQLHDLGVWVKSAKQLAADVTLISEVFNGNKPASDINGPQVTADAGAFDAAASAFEKVKRPQKLSVCPHAQ